MQYRKMYKFKKPSGRFRREKNPSSVPAVEVNPSVVHPVA
jgi:hypothetical protein